MLAHEQVVETRCDELAANARRGEASRTVIQFRLSSGPDPGRAIVKHRRDHRSQYLSRLSRHRFNSPECAPVPHKMIE